MAHPKRTGMQSHNDGGRCFHNQASTHVVSGAHKVAEEALKWFKAAAEQGNARACFWLGRIHEVENDGETSLKWYRKGVENRFRSSNVSYSPYFCHGGPLFGVAIAEFLNVGIYLLLTFALDRIHETQFSACL